MDMSDKGNITIRYMQKYLAAKEDVDKKHFLENQDQYFIKLVEEVGELARVLCRGRRHATSIDDLKGSLEEELYDILYYTLMLASYNGVDMETWIPLKEELNNKRYPSGVVFDPTGEKEHSD